LLRQRAAKSLELLSLAMAVVGIAGITLAGARRPGWPR
jgi:hypothetical protein